MKLKNMAFNAAIILSAISANTYATCTVTGVSQTEDNRTAQIPFGKINLTDAHLLPVGTQLASVVVPPTNYTYGGATASSVIWECDQADLGGIYYLVATNGDDRIGGFYDIGQMDGLTDVYATWFAYVGIRQSMSGVNLTRYWQRVPVTSYNLTDTGKIQIRLQDIPPLQAELFRVSSLPGTAAASSYCGNNNNSGSGIGFASANGTNYTCIQPNSYIQLAGDSSVTFNFAHDEIGEDSAYNYDSWWSDNGFGYGMRAANTIYETPTCVTRNYTPVVYLPTITTADLNAGSSVNSNFNVQVECSNTSVSGVGANQTAIGFQVSTGAYSAAESLGLVNSSGGVSALLSDQYGTEGVAGGVGITLQNSEGTNMNFIGQPGTIDITTPGGNAAGWYPVLAGATEAGTSASGYTNYNQTFTATLEKITGQDVTPGRVFSTAYILVKMQ